MRGVVTLAAVLALPEETPHRGMLLLVAFVVVVGTLSLQGLTLPALARRARAARPRPGRGRPGPGRAASECPGPASSGWTASGPTDDPRRGRGVAAQQVRRSAVSSAWERLGRPHDEYEPPTAAYLRLRLAMLESERAALIKARDEGRYDDEVLRAGTTVLDVEESLLDRAELSNERLAERPRPGARGAGLRAPAGGADAGQAAGRRTGARSACGTGRRGCTCGCA